MDPIQKIERQETVRMIKNSLPGKYEGFGEPQYSGWAKESLYVEGFDKTRLAVDVVRPADEQGWAVTGRFPAIVLLSRGGRFGEPNEVNGVNIIRDCVPYGYVGVIAEMRGCGASFGVNDSFSSIENRKDVNTLLDWIGGQEWSDGQAVTYGGSNRGLIQYAAAVTRPAPSSVLKGITPVVSNPDFYYQDYPNGVSAIPKRKLSGSTDGGGKKTKEELLEKVAPVDGDKDGSQAYEAYEKDQFGNNRSFMGHLILENMCRDDNNPNFNGEKTNITIPPVTDIDVFRENRVGIHQFAGFLESGPFGQLMAAKEWGGSIVVGPWDHRQSRSGVSDFPEGNFDFCAEHRKWFDYLLKGIPNGFGERPPFIYYTLGAQEKKRWRCSDTWPVENARPATLYLCTETSGTCCSVNDGSLSLDRPATESSVSYKVDTSIQVFDNGDGASFDRMHMTWDGNMAPGVDEKGLTFTSAPLFERYDNEIVGCTSVDLWVACTHRDADFIAYLEEVLPDGQSRYISMGCLRASHRTSAPRRAWDESGAVYHPCMQADRDRCLEEGMNEPVHLQFAIEPIAYRFQKGSRVRITITCADTKSFQHPMYDEKDLPVISLYQGGEHPSFVRIPFIEREENVYNGTISKGEYNGPGTLYFFRDHMYVYYNGTWEKYESGAREALWEIREGKAYFGAGFAFEMEGLPQRNGILQDYQGGEKAVIPFPAKRHLVVDRVSVAPDSEKLYMPDVKTLCLEEFTWNTIKEGQKGAPCILYLHGYSRTPSELGVQQVEYLKRGYTVIGIDMRNYPSNPFPDYLYDIKGCTRYVRAHAAWLGIAGERLGASGQSLGGNAALLLAVTGSCPELEGTVGGNAGISSRIQAAVAGYGWTDLLSMGPDLLEEYRDASDAVKKQKYENTDGPTGPAAAVIGFQGKGKGLKALRSYREERESGEGRAEDGHMEQLLKLEYQASPINHIGPDTPPMALYSGVGMMRVDIANRQTYRTFERMGSYGVDCYMFCNTNGAYGVKPEIVEGVMTFLDRYLKNEPPVRKTVAVPQSLEIVEDGVDRRLSYPLVVKRDGCMYVACKYLEERFGAAVRTAAVIDSTQYAAAKELKGTGAGFRYYEDKNMAVLVPEDDIPEELPQKRG